MSYGYYGFAPYVSVAEKKNKALKQIDKLRKKKPDLAPVVIPGRTLAHSWWGKSWNKNIERYADFSNRLGRGRSYVRCACVLDLQIKKGEVHSLVAGSGRKPYEVKIEIAPLSRRHLTRITNQAQEQLQSLTDLLAGKFPVELQNLFFESESGLFPQPADISFSCSCPDWASMCKHVAATLYGVGARLDEEPSHFFTLRHIDQTSLISEAITTQTDALLKKATTGKGRRRRLADDEVSAVFNVDLQKAEKPKKKTVKKKVAKKKTTKKKVIKKKTAKKSASKKTGKKITTKKKTK